MSTPFYMLCVSTEQQKLEEISKQVQVQACAALYCVLNWILIGLPTFLFNSYSIVSTHWVIHRDSVHTFSPHASTTDCKFISCTTSITNCKLLSTKTRVFLWYLPAHKFHRFIFINQQYCIIVPSGRKCL